MKRLWLRFPGLVCARERSRSPNLLTGDLFLTWLWGAVLEPKGSGSYTDE